MLSARCDRWANTPYSRETVAAGLHDSIGIGLERIERDTAGLARLCEFPVDEIIATLTVERWNAIGEAIERVHHIAELAVTAHREAVALTTSHARTRCQR